MQSDDKNMCLAEIVERRVRAQEEKDKVGRGAGEEKKQAPLEVDFVPALA